AILTIVVGAFIAWLTYEFVNFAGIPELRITQPPGDVAALHATQIEISGVTAPDARISVDGLGENREVMADHQGDFSFTAALRPGSNVVELTATDPKTNRESEKQRRTINVATASGPTPGAVVVAKPTVGAKLASPVAISGTAPDGTTLTVSATLVTTAAPSFAIVDANGAAVVLKSKTTRPLPLRLKAAGGAFTGSLGLAPGTWDLSVAAGGGAAAVTRRVIIQPPAGLKGKLTVTKSESYIEIDEDGRPKAGVSGGIGPPGFSVALSASTYLRIRSGNAGAVEVSLNGLALGLMGAPGEVVEWRITRSK
ncbi:MAG: DUF4115 domain-containing protein, partial [Chloroflexota bacterium]|nr:DUF4115 domain-containing protein [Chloroflexota bacterium]